MEPADVRNTVFIKTIYNIFVIKEVSELRNIVSSYFDRIGAVTGKILMIARRNSVRNTGFCENIVSRNSSFIVHIIIVFGEVSHVHDKANVFHWFYCRQSTASVLNESHCQF